MPHLTEAQQIVYSCIVSAVIIVNAIEICILFRKYKKLTNYEWLLLSLSVSDLLVGFSKGTLTFLYRAKILLSQIDDGMLPLWFSVACSVAHTFGITIERLLAVAYPIKHRMWSKNRNLALILISAWSFGCLTFPINYITGAKQIDVYIAILIIITSSVLIFSYSYIIYKVIIKRRRLLSKPSGLSLEQAINTKREFNLVCMCFAISLTFVAMMLPSAISLMMRGEISTPAYFPMISNSMTNPLLYFFWKYLDEKVKARKVKKSLSHQTGKDRTLQLNSKKKQSLIGLKRKPTAPANSINSSEINFTHETDSNQLQRSSVNERSVLSHQATETEVMKMGGICVAE